jgi:cold shock CspA family protein
MAVEGVFGGWALGKSFGFIRPDGGLPDVFLHKADVPASTRLQSGTRLSFRIERSIKGPRACDVMVIAHVAERSKQRSEVDPIVKTIFRPQ